MCERAFGALDNLVQILPVEELARLDMAGLWSVTAKLLFEFFTRASEAEYGVLESLTALLWSFLRKYEEAGKLATISGVVSEQNLEQFVYLARSEITPVVRANSVGSLGVVFRIAGRTKHFLVGGVGFLLMPTWLQMTKCCELFAVQYTRL